MKEFLDDKIFNYSDYRKFLQDYFTEQKRLKKIFSHRYFAQKAGFSSSSFVSHVMKGERNLTDKSLYKMIKGLNLKGKAKNYFEKLVMYNQSKDLEEKKFFYDDLLEIKKNNNFEPLTKDQYAYYEHWYNPVIRELIIQDKWDGDFKKLSKMVIPKITPKQAEEAVQMLVDTGLISCDDGIYTQGAEFVTSEKVPSFVLKEARNEYIKLGVRASELMDSSQRFITSTTFTMTKEAYDEVVEEIEKIRRKIILTKSTENRGDVYQFNIQLFPMSN